MEFLDIRESLIDLINQFNSNQLTWKEFFIESSKAVGGFGQYTRSGKIGRAHV